MRILLVAVGTRLPAWVQQGYAEYAQRMPPHCRLELIEVAAKKRGKNADIKRILRDEALAIQNATPKDTLVIALDRKGKQIDTEQFASSLQGWIGDNQTIALLIGGPEGIAADYLKTVQTKWRLSSMTFAHPIVRIMVAEQVYRAWSIIANLPYHRGD